MFFGRGAGELPTASAVVGDVFDIARNIEYNCCTRISCTCYKQLPIKKMEDTYNSYYVRLQAEDRCGVLAELTKIFAENQVSIEEIVQKRARSNQLAEIVVITSKVREGDFTRAMDAIKKLERVKEISSLLRVYRAE